MKRNLKAQEKRDNLIKEFKKLDRNKIHILYFDYKLNFYNLYHNTALLATKALSWVTFSKDIDHVCHISRFNYDRSKKIWSPKVFEAQVNSGMIENDLFHKLYNFKGTCYIETLKNTNKNKAKLFEEKYSGISYSKTAAFLSGFDIGKSSRKASKNGGFCSWLVALFLIDQGYKLRREEGNALEMTPTDIWKEKISKKNKKILYKS